MRSAQAHGLQQAAGLGDREEAPTQHGEHEGDDRLQVPRLLGGAGKGGHHEHDAHGRDHPGQHQDGHPQRVAPLGPQQQGRAHHQHRHAHQAEEEGGERLARDDRPAGDGGGQEAAHGAVLALLEQAEHPELDGEEDEEDRHRGGVERLRRQLLGRRRQIAQAERAGDGHGRLYQRLRLPRLRLPADYPEVGPQGGPHRVDLADELPGHGAAHLSGDGAVHVGHHQDGRGAVLRRRGREARRDHEGGVDFGLLGQGARLRGGPDLLDVERPFGVERPEHLLDEGAGGGPPVLVGHGVGEVHRAGAEAAEEQAEDRRQPEGGGDPPQVEAAVSQPLADVLQRDEKGGHG